MLAHEYILCVLWERKSTSVCPSVTECFWTKGNNSLKYLAEWIVQRASEQQLLYFMKDKHFAKIPQIEVASFVISSVCALLVTSTLSAKRKVRHTINKKSFGCKFYLQCGAFQSGEVHERKASSHYKSGRQPIKLFSKMMYEQILLYPFSIEDWMNTWDMKHAETTNNTLFNFLI